MFSTGFESTGLGCKKGESIHSCVILSQCCSVVFLPVSVPGGGGGGGSLTLFTSGGKRDENWNRPFL